MPGSVVLLLCAVTPSSYPPFATPSPSALKGNKSTAATRRDCHQLLSAVFATGNICCQGFQHFVQVLSSLFTHFVVCIIRFNICSLLSDRFNCLWLEKHVHLEVIPLISVFVYRGPRNQSLLWFVAINFGPAYSYTGQHNFTKYQAGPILDR